MLIYFVHKNIILNNYFKKKKISIQICKLGNALNANEEMLTGYAEPDVGYPDADPDATYFEYRLCWYWCWFMYQNYVLVLYMNIHILSVCMNDLIIWQRNDFSMKMYFVNRSSNQEIIPKTMLLTKTCYLLALFTTQMVFYISKVIYIS